MIASSQLYTISTPKEPVDDPPAPGNPDVPEREPLIPDPYPVTDPIPDKPEPRREPDPDGPNREPDFPTPPEPIPQFPPDVTF